MKLLIVKFKNMDKQVHKLYLNGLKFCLVLMLLSIFILTLYLSVHNPYIFYIGISLVKTSLFYTVFFIICALAIDTIKNG